MFKHLLSLCLLLLAHHLFVSGQIQSGAANMAVSKNSVDDEWQSKVQSYITASEYFFKHVGDNNSYYVANKKQHAGFTFNDAGFTVSPVRFTGNQDKNNDWMVNMQLKYIGKGAGNLFKPSVAVNNFDATENNLVARHPGFSIEYLNNESGLRQNFIIDKKPGGNENLCVRLKVISNLHAVSENNNLVFSNDKGVTQLYYRDLKVWDANHQLLKANMQMKNGELVITVDDSKAVYPVTIDPINQTPEWTTSADGILPTLIGQLAVDAAYGFSVAGLGDVNGDGFDDVAVGAPA
ncbi:MAG: integrin alpha, partial [Bacteroidota bacterium]